ncbi:S8 family serine peptidase [Pontibacter sp. G13]|uniref:S8 family serine peptidase n=1 Tax=Pontibacter sp. G13 TaxID=3074898 RepID=UPI00288C1B6A|nr:S8 family serine peptidase [Pontibacter sp. G13]WNJ20669.1 S8 family serine peptidase [Pontibacter sp. G13]
MRYSRWIFGFGIGWMLGLSSMAFGQSNQSSAKVLHAPDRVEEMEVSVLVAKKGMNQDLSPKVVYEWITATPERIRMMDLQADSILWISHESRMARPEGPVSDLSLLPNQLTYLIAEFPFLDGTGQVLGLREPPFDTTDYDLRGRWVTSPSLEGSVDAHATDMATIIGGAGNSSIQGLGVAPEVQFESVGFGDLIPLSPYFDEITFVQNHSYGTEVESFYGGLARAYEQHSLDNPDLLHVFSAGNAGETTPQSGKYGGIPQVSNLTGNFKHAKNILVVGAMDTLGLVPSYSSKGPAFDGRIKPEIVAYSQSGTSQSAALVSGLGVLLQQAHLAKYNEPASSALLKALMINGATDIGAPGPDFLGGYGNVNGYRSVETLDHGHFATGFLAEGQADTILLPVPDGATGIKATLVWTDTISSIEQTDYALVNDLDLMVRADGQIHLPWVLNHVADSLYVPARKGVDSLNNIEQVEALFQSQNISLVVQATSLETLQQTFAIAYQWEFPDTLIWWSPVQASPFPYDGSSSDYLLWESHLTASDGMLQFRQLPDSNWIDIGQVDLDRGRYRWFPRAEFGIGQFRMVVGNKSFDSPEFPIASFLRPRVGLDCDTLLELSWNSVELANEYRIWAFDGLEMEIVAETSATTWATEKTSFPAGYFAIQPVLADGTAGLRSYGFDYRNLGGTCYFQQWYAFGLQSEGIELFLTLGSILNARELVLERETEGGFMELERRSPQLEMQFIDSDPAQGTNRYRVRLLLENGQELLSDWAEAVYLEDPQFWVFPNPSRQDEWVNIFSQVSDTQTVFELMDMNGRRVRNVELVAEIDLVELAGLPTGIYAYRIVRGDLTFTGKLLIVP